MCLTSSDVIFLRNTEYILIYQQATKDDDVNPLAFKILNIEVFAVSDRFGNVLLSLVSMFISERREVCTNLCHNFKRLLT